MAKRPVVIRKDNPKSDELAKRIQQGSRDLREEFLYLVTKLENEEIPPQERLEVLAGRFETYAIRLGESPEYLIFDFDSQDGKWTVLDICRGLRFRDRAYHHSCAAHGLKNPTREQN